MLQNTTHSRKHSSTQSSDSDIPGPLNRLQQLNSRTLRRNSISLPSGLNTIDNEAIQHADINDKINENENVSNSLHSLNCIVCMTVIIYTRSFKSGCLINQYRLKLLFTFLFFVLILLFLDN